MAHASQPNAAANPASAFGMSAKWHEANLESELLEAITQPQLDCQYIRVLLIEDDEDDYVLVRSLLSDISSSTYQLQWVSTFDAGLEEMSLSRHDVYLLDYRLGNRSGLELLQIAIRHGCKAPVIFLTGFGDYEVDVRAMKAGAADYLVKGHINAPLLERAIRYSIERWRIGNQLRLLSSQLLNALEDERNRIARELHDSIGSSLTAIKFGLETTLGQMERGKASPETVKTLISITQSTIDETRRIMTDLRPSILDDLGIVATISWFCREFQKVYANVRIEEKIEIEEPDVPENLKIVIFRLIQEAFHNAAKYSKSDLIRLTIGKANGAIDLAIEDNGVGFDLESVLERSNHSKGLGLTSMKERAELSGGSFAIKSTVGKGTTIRASWPYHDTA